MSLLSFLLGIEISKLLLQQWIHKEPDPCAEAPTLVLPGFPYIISADKTGDWQIKIKVYNNVYVYKLSQ